MLLAKGMLLMHKRRIRLARGILIAGRRRLPVPRALLLWSETALTPTPQIQSSINAEILKRKLIIYFKNSFAAALQWINYSLSFSSYSLLSLANDRVRISKRKQVGLEGVGVWCCWNRKHKECALMWVPWGTWQVERDESNLIPSPSPRKQWETKLPCYTFYLVFQKRGKLKSSKQKFHIIKKINLLFITTSSVQFSSLCAH